LLNSLAAGRDFARKAALIQLGAGLLAAAVAGLAWGAGHAAGAFTGAAAAALGTMGLARVALGGGVQPARVAYLRLLAGMLLKWLLVALMIYLALVRGRLPPLATLSGLVLALLVFPLAHLSGSATRQDTQGDK
jgi:ATP synthase protein I